MNTRGQQEHTKLVWKKEIGVWDTFIQGDDNYYASLPTRRKLALRHETNRSWRNSNINNPPPPLKIRFRYRSKSRIICRRWSRCSYQLSAAQTVLRSWQTIFSGRRMRFKPQVIQDTTVTFTHYSKRTQNELYALKRNSRAHVNLCIAPFT